MSLQSMMDTAEITPTRRRRRRLLGCLPFVLVIALVVAGGLYLNRHRQLLPIPVVEGCQVDDADGIVDLELPQMANAGTIAAVAISRNLPERAVTISLATAMQESRLENLTSGDRDSIGLFQQRPSQGWGTPAQIADPVYSTNKFLDKLVEIPGYAQLPLTVAAQDVQHSGYPDAYAAHEADATTLSGAFTGRVPAAMTCQVNSVGAAVSGAIGPNGLQPGGTALAQQVSKDFGSTVSTKAAPVTVPGSSSGSASAGASSSSDDAAGDGSVARGLSVNVSPGSGASGVQRGWAVAQWAVAHCQDLHITSVAYGGKIWQSVDSTDGWTASTVAGTGSPVRITVAAEAPGQASASAQAG